MTSKPSVLVVDDDNDTRSLVQLVLESRGLNVETCAGGPEALEKLETFTPSVILLDIMMPEMNGYEVLLRLKQRTEWQNIPVIMLTAKSEGDDIIEGYQQGAHYYIPKPFTTEQLLYGIQMFISETA